jgi:hypothetical protein
MTDRAERGTGTPTGMAASVVAATADLIAPLDAIK